MKMRVQSSGSGLYNKPKESNESGSPAIADWAVTDDSKFSRLSKEAKIESRRAPELWIPDGQERLVRYIDDKPAASFKVYNIQHNGKWRSFVAPAEGKPDLFASVLGLKASRVFLWRVIDINGYKDKQGKEHKNQPRFHVTKTKLFDQLQAIIKESETPLNEFNIKITRTGTQTNTTYSFFPKAPSAMTPEMLKVAANFPKFTDYYRPPSLSQQEAFVIARGKSLPSTDSED